MRFAINLLWTYIFATFHGWSVQREYPAVRLYPPGTGYFGFTARLDQGNRPLRRQLSYQMNEWLGRNGAI
jgi:hypothetical protein